MSNIRDKQFWAEGLKKEPTKVWWWCVGASVAAMFLLMFLQAIQLPSLIAEHVLPHLEKPTELILDAISAVATGVLGAAILNIVYSMKENYVLESLKNLNYPDLLGEMCYILGSFGGKCRLDERIEVTMKPFIDNNSPIPELITIYADYEFQTNQMKDCIQLMYERCYDGNIGSYLSGTSEELKGLEFYWGNDESSDAFRLQNNNGTYVNDDSYKVTRVSVAGKTLDVPLPKISTLKDTNNTRIMYDISLPDDVKKKIADSTDGFVKVVISVSFPMESESILSITHEYPTKDSKVSVDYAAIANTTNVYLMPATGPISVERQQPASKSNYIEYRHSEWLIPKTGYIISWWK